jgi:hypothetical protein
VVRLTPPLRCRVGSDAEVARQRELERTAETGPLRRQDDRLLDPLDAVEQIVDLAVAPAEGDAAGVVRSVDATTSARATTCARGGSVGVHDRA